MDVSGYYRNRIRKVRDSYTTTALDRKKFYQELIVSDGWRQPSMIHKLGAKQVDWLYGLVEYGTKLGWDLEVDSCRKNTSTDR